MSETRLGWPVLLALVGALLLLFALYPKWEGGGVLVKFALVIAGAILLLAAGLMALEWAIDHIGNAISNAIYRAQQARSITPETELIRMISHMQPWQAELWLLYRPRLVAVPGVAGADLSYNVDGVIIPADWLWDYLDESAGDYMKPIRDYSEGSVGRKWAEALYNFYLKRGQVYPAAGNKPARWRYGYASAVQWFTLIDEEDE